MSATSFSQYLTTHAADDSSIGDLATALAADSNVDVAALRDVDDLTRYLDRVGAPPAALAAAQVAWLAYRRATSSATSLYDAVRSP